MDGIDGEWIERASRVDRLQMVGSKVQRFEAACCLARSRRGMKRIQVPRQMCLGFVFVLCENRAGIVCFSSPTYALL